jgi:hypothetical protein
MASECGRHGHHFGKIGHGLINGITSARPRGTHVVHKHVLLTLRNEMSTSPTHIRRLIVQKSVAIVQRFEELKGDNVGNVLYPDQLMDVRQAQNPESGESVSSMASFFVERLFEVHVHTVCLETGRPAMGLHEFADFLLAWNYRGFRPSAQCALVCAF